MKPLDMTRPFGHGALDDAHFVVPRAGSGARSEERS